MRPQPSPQLVNGLRQLVGDVRHSDVDLPPGLASVQCASTTLIGFPEGRVEYCGVDVASLVDAADFEAVAWLLINCHQPDDEELADLSSILSDSSVVDAPAAETMACLPLQTRALDLLPLSISLLSCIDPTPGDTTLAAGISKFWRVLAQLPVLLHVCFGGKLEDGRIVTADGCSVSYAGRLLQVLRQSSVMPSPREERLMNAILIHQALTEMRPACFSARVFGGTVSDIAAGLSAAASMFVSQLRNDPFQWMGEQMRDFMSPEQSESWLRKRSYRLPCGFSDCGIDYRAGLLQLECAEILGSRDRILMEASCKRVERLMEAEGFYPTIDWVSAKALTMLDVPVDRISLGVGIARLAGWAAQAAEQRISGVKLLPKLRYPSAADGVN